MVPPRPFAITVVAWGLALLTTVSLAGALIYGISVPVRVYAMAMALVSYAVIWFLHQRRNWARLLMLAYSVVVILNGLTASGFTAESLGRAAIGVFLLFFLNRPDVRAWFTARP